MLFDQIKAGARVTIKTPQGQERSGRAVMFNREAQAWVLNMGGRYGMPGIATAKNVVKVGKAKADAFTAQSKIINEWRD